MWARRCRPGMSLGKVSHSSFSVPLIPGDMSPGKAIPSDKSPGKPRILKFQLLPMDESDPPFFEFYKNLFEKEEPSKKNCIGVFDDVEEWDLPVIDLSRLCGEGWESAKCKKEIAEASQKYGFFQVGSYRWGTPSATCLRQLAWSEAFHVPLTDISNMGGLTSLRLNLSSLNQGTVLRIDHSILAVELQPRSRPSGNSLW
ncbi:hypothetical protein Tco_0889628 [Tanacetum coccineum]